MNKFYLKNLNSFFLYVGIFSFLFLWDISIDFFNLRYLIALPVIYILINFQSLNFKKIFYSIIIPVSILLHFLLLSFKLEYDITLRDYFGLLLLFLIYIIVSLNRLKIIVNLKYILNSFLILFTISYIIFFISTDSNLILNCYDGWFFKNKFIYLENSHFAIVAVPIINYFLIQLSNKISLLKKDFIILIFFILFVIISFINFSTTFLVGIILTNFFIIIKKYKNKKFLVISLVLILISSVIIYNYKQCFDRSIGSINQIKNFYSLKELYLNQEITKDEFNQKKIDYRFSMSVETFLISLEITKKSFLDNIFGVGFNKYYISHKKYIDTIVKTDDQIKKNNIYDGSSNISKIITEFGIFGLLLFLIIFFYYLKIKKIHHINFFLLSIILMQLIRGVGYFNGGFVLAIILLFGGFNFKKIILKKYVNSKS